MVIYTNIYKLFSKYMYEIDYILLFQDSKGIT